MYLNDPERLEKLRKREREKDLKRQLRVEKTKRKELARRLNYARLFAARPCIGDPETGFNCHNNALPGSQFCLEHGGSVARHRQVIVLRMMALIEPALKTVFRCMASSDESIALKAAETILDRTGYGRSATLHLEEKKEDLAQLSEQQLVLRANKLIAALGAKQEETDQVIDVEVTDKSVH